MKSSYLLWGILDFLSFTLFVAALLGGWKLLIEWVLP